MFPAVARAGPASNHAAAAVTKYSFSTLNNQNDPTFNQLLGINSHNVISGYFGSGAAGRMQWVRQLITQVPAPR